MMDYWEECISDAADECNLVLTEEQIKYIADSVCVAHENYGMYMGYDRISLPEKEAKEGDNDKP